MRPKTQWAFLTPWCYSNPVPIEARPHSSLNPGMVGGRSSKPFPGPELPSVSPCLLPQKEESKERKKEREKEKKKKRRRDGRQAVWMRDALCACIPLGQWEAGSPRGGGGGCSKEPKGRKGKEGKKGEREREGGKEEWRRLGVFPTMIQGFNLCEKDGWVSKEAANRILFFILFFALLANWELKPGLDRLGSILFANWCVYY
nr:PREDICTED: uncharacterized protein LOC103281752 [Anolis carolinensis]|eukprot:XP_008122111.1 PREDICTED: uncharacterized protein LOC103281752 [Anolis carolinensis]